MKSINKKLMKEKLKNYKERNKEHELDLNNQANQMHGKCLILQAKIQNY